MEHVSDDSLVLERGNADVIYYNKRQVGDCFAHITLLATDWLPSATDRQGKRFHVKVFPPSLPAAPHLLEYQHHKYVYYRVVRVNQYLTCHPVDTNGLPIERPVGVSDKTLACAWSYAAAFLHYLSTQFVIHGGRLLAHHPSIPSIHRRLGTSAKSIRSLNIGGAQTISMKTPTFPQLQQQIVSKFSAPAHFLPRTFTYWSRSADDYWSQPGDDIDSSHTVSQTNYRAHPQVELARAKDGIDVDNFGLITRYTQEHVAQTVVVCADEWADSIFRVVIYEPAEYDDRVFYDNSGILKFQVLWGQTISSKPVGDLYLGNTHLTKDVFLSVAQLFTTLLNHEFNKNGRYAYQL